MQKALSLKIIKVLFAIVGLLCCIYATATVHVITVQRLSFNPPNVNALTGDTIQWLWVAGKHTIAADSVPTDATLWNTVLNKTASTYSYVVTLPGLYKYSCAVHSKKMKGIIRVEQRRMAAPVPQPVPVVPLNEADTGTVHIYPSPFSKQLTIDLSSNKLFKNKVKIEVFDALGNLKFENPDSQFHEPLTINLSTLIPGVYLVNISDGIIKRTYRVVKSQ